MLRAVFKLFRSPQLLLYFLPYEREQEVHKCIAMFLVTSSIVIYVSNRGLLAVETMYAIVQWLANLNIKRNMTSMFVNKKRHYSPETFPS